MTDAQSGQPESPPRRRRKLSAIMMADVSGYSRMMGADDERTVDRIQDFHARVQALVQQFEGRVVNTAGDSVFGEFDSVIQAVECACRIQAELGTRNAGLAAEERLEVRIGVHLGDVIVEDYQVYGDGVNIAARLEPMADPGGICMSEAVYQQVRNKLDVPVQDLGLRELKNIQYPVHVFKVPPRTGAAPPSVAPPPREPKAVPAATARAPAAPAERSQLLRPSNVTLLSLGVVLLVSPVLLFPTGGVFSTAGVILIGIAVGRAWTDRSGDRGRLPLALGIALASGAVWTNWSRVTNVLFVVAGVIIAATGQRRRSKD